jgi:pimeloyl-ACP methyl ester carboxylesterase
MPLLGLAGRHIEYRIVLGDALKVPTLVFLHEGLGCTAMWRDFPDKIARKTGARALVYSRFGYGQSSGLDAPRTPRFMHEEALEVLPQILDRLQITMPILIGHSDGASIALIHAASAERPVSGIVLIAPHVMVEPITVQRIAEVCETYEIGGLRERLVRYHANVDDAFIGWSRIWLDPRFRSWSLGSESSRLDVPCLLIQGDKDEYGTLAQIDAIAEVARRAPQRVVLAGAGHALRPETEAQVIAAIADFALNRNER